MASWDYVEWPCSELLQGVVLSQRWRPQHHAGAAASLPCIEFRGVSAA